MDIQILTKVIELCNAHNITEFTSPEFSFRIDATRSTTKPCEPDTSTPDKAADIIRAQLYATKASMLQAKKMQEQEDLDLEMWSVADDSDE